MHPLSYFLTCKTLSVVFLIRNSCVSDQKHDLKKAKPSILPPGVKEFIQQGFLGPCMVEFSGGSRGGAQGPWHPPTPIFRPNWGLKGSKMFVWRSPPPSLSKDLDYWPPPPLPPLPLSQCLDPALELIHVFCIRRVTIFFFLFLALADFHNTRKNKELWCWCLCSWLLRLNPAVVAP